MTRALSFLDDQVWWHRLRRHRVDAGLIVGHPARFYSHYCYDCEIAW